MTRSRKDYQNDAEHRRQNERIAVLAQLAANDGNVGLQKTCGQALAGNKRARAEAMKVILAAESLTRNPSYARHSPPRGKTTEEWEEMQREEREIALASKEYESGRGRKKGGR